MRCRPASWITLVGLASIILACGGDATPTAPDIDGFGGALTAEKKPKGKPADPIPLIVTFDAGAVTGDGAGRFEGDYVDGEEGVEALIRTNGNFLLSVLEASRQLRLDFPSFDADGNTTIGPPFDADCVVGRMSMHNPFNDPDIGLAEMPVPSTMDAALSVSWVEVIGLRSWRLFFGRVCESSSGSVEANLVKITRLDADTWTIVGGNAILCKDELTGKGKGKNLRTEEWRGAMPFFLKAKKK